MLTLGRIVSLRDYEDFARAFAGIAKALATGSGTARARRSFVTVAGPTAPRSPDDGPVRSEPARRDGQRPRDPHVGVTVRQTTRRATSAWRQASRRDPALLAAAGRSPTVEAALRERFSFDAPRRSASASRSARSIAVLHGVGGVVAVDVDAAPPGTRAAVEPVAWTRALPRRRGDDEAAALPAELLTLDPRPLATCG